MTKMIPAVRLASHEVEELTKNRFREARLKRLHQVREQSSQFARNIRDAREEKKEKILKGMEIKLKQKIDSEVKTMIQEMEEEVLTCLTKFGGAHARANQENEENYEAIRLEQLTKNRMKATHLGKDALKELKLQRQQTSIEQNKKILQRKQALDTEAVRSSYIASLPPVQVVAETVKEDPPKVIRFDKSTLFQTEYVIKHKIVEAVRSPQDARQAAMLSEMETNEFVKKKEEKKMEDDKKILKRGKEALVKEKSHSNYLRLLDELDKMEQKPEKDWDVESTSTTIDRSSSETSSRATSPPTSACLSTDRGKSLPIENPSDAPRSQPTEEACRQWSSDEEMVPVRDSTARKLIAPPKLNAKDTQQLNEIGHLLKELKEEQERWIASDQANILKGVESKSTSSSIRSSSSTSDGLVLFSDDDLEIRFDVMEKSDTSSDDSRLRKNLANALNAIRKERIQLDSILESSKPTKRPGILRRPNSMPDSCATSTPLANNNAKQASTEDNRKQVLKHYVQKLLEMKSQDVRELSISTSSSSNSTSTPKSLTGSIPPCRPAPTTPEGAEWSTRTDSSPSAYDSPASSTEQSSSKISNASSLPLGAEASAYRRSDAGKWDSNGLFTLGPLLDVYNDVYQAYNQRLRVMAEERRSPQQTPPWQESSTESSFMSLTLSATSTERSTVSRQRSCGFPGDRSSFSVGLSLSSSSSGNSSREPSSVQDWDKVSVRSKVCTSLSSTISDLKSINLSTTSSQDVSMPDVDEALKRLGLPSMQSVLRR
ncbi:serine-rich adhesin for platelets-like [Daphnia carinata]|uniref:serine-rich adhesin for platelets-like n=1 Tax=Daphnia carinata TaxID=120202 RepID=UPI00257E0AC7|nr:serine-rich adhesin for platelets-like [Daphnia carinata]